MNPLAVIPASAVEHTTRLHQTIMTTNKPELSIRKWKLIKGTFVSSWVVGLAAYAIHSGADPTWTAGIAVVTVALLNGIEAGELIAAYGELTGGLGGAGSESQSNSNSAADTDTEPRTETTPDPSNTDDRDHHGKKTHKRQRTHRTGN